MLHLLNPDRFSTVEPLFGELPHHHLFCAGVLSGKYPGQIFVDDPEHPQAALLVKDGFWAYLGGDADNAAFNQALHDGFFDKQITGAKSGGLLISVASDSWRDVLQSMFPERPPVAMPRRHYAAHSSAFNGLIPVAEGFTLHFIDENLSAHTEGPLPGDVQRVIELRADASKPDEAAYGYVALQERNYAAHAVIDCIVGEKGDIGLFTADAFRRRGLAAATSAAAIAYGLAHGLSEVFWDCAAHNIGSVRTAEKLGLRLTLEHLQYLVVHNENGHWINLAWNHLDAGEYPLVLEVCDRLTAQKPDVSPAFYFLAGAAWGGMGDQQRALESIKTAADRGWDGLADTQNCEPLAVLHGSPEWENVLERIQANADKPAR